MDEEDLMDLFPDPLNNPYRETGFIDKFWDLEREECCGMGVGLDIPDFLEEDKDAWTSSKIDWDRTLYGNPRIFKGTKSIAT